MNPNINRNVSLIGVPMDLGADRRGVDMGPSAIRCAELEERLERVGYRIRDCGDLTVRRTRRYSTAPESNLKYLYEIARVNQELCEIVSHRMAQGDWPLVLGGDHSIAIGTLAGVQRRVPRLGVIWFDAHGDVNTAETSPSGNIHGMPLAVAMGRGHPLLTRIGGEARKVKPERVVLIGARSLDPGERQFLKEAGVAVFTMQEIDKLGMPQVMEQALHVAGTETDGVHLSLDLDGLDPGEAPGVGTPVPAGISLREGLLAMEMISESGRLVSAEVVEVNPTLDIRNRTAKAAVELIAAFMGERIL
jgi:arginase